MSGHRDVDVPEPLRHRIGTLLADFEEYVRAVRPDVVLERVEKPEGNHVTPWWLYATLNNTKKSRVVFGETTYAAVNSVPHMWARGKADYINVAVGLLVGFIEWAVENSETTELLPTDLPTEEIPRRPPKHYLKAAFDGTAYGSEYLVAEEGALIYPLSMADEQGWVEGILSGTGRRGWYPFEWVRVEM